MKLPWKKKFAARYQLLISYKNESVRIRLNTNVSSLFFFACSAIHYRFDKQFKYNPISLKISKFHPLHSQEYALVSWKCLNPNLPNIKNPRKRNLSEITSIIHSKRTVNQKYRKRKKIFKKKYTGLPIFQASLPR